jgi:hypothetical protein
MTDPHLMRLTRIVATLAAGDAVTLPPAAVGRPGFEATETLRFGRSPVDGVSCVTLETKVGRKGEEANAATDLQECSRSLGEMLTWITGLSDVDLAAVDEAVAKSDVSGQGTLRDMREMAEAPDGEVRRIAATRWTLKRVDDLPTLVAGENHQPKWSFNDCVHMVRIGR